MAATRTYANGATVWTLTLQVNAEQADATVMLRGTRWSRGTPSTFHSEALRLVGPGRAWDPDEALSVMEAAVRRILADG